MIEQRGPVNKSIFLTVYAELLLSSSQKTKLNQSDLENNVFSSPTVPQISIVQYLERLVSHLGMEKATLISSLIYIDRYCNYTKQNLNKFTIHRLILTSVLLALKFNEDLIYKNSHYAVIGGVSLEELNTLEYNFLKVVDFSLFIEKAEFDRYKEYIHKIMKSNEN